MRRISNGIFDAPFIKVDVEVTIPGSHNGTPNITKTASKYVVAPTAKKIATYMTNQIFGSDILTGVEGMNVSWIMPTLKESFENAIYCTESFIQILIFEGRVYLKFVPKCQIFNLVQNFDKVKSCSIIDETDDGECRLERDMEFFYEDGSEMTVMAMTAFQKDRNGEFFKMPLSSYNNRYGTDWQEKYVLPYRNLINIDTGEQFFDDSKNLLENEMKVINVLSDEIQKTRTRIAATQHYTTTDVVTGWKPASSFQVETLSVNDLHDYFTLLPGDRDHQMFEFLQGNIRVADYEQAFKFYDYQVIQMAGLSPASFGYEKDAYMNVANVNLSGNATDMTVEAMKTQITPQIDSLFKNIMLCQQSSGFEQTIPEGMTWDFGDNEKFDDMKKLKVLSEVQKVASIPYTERAKIIQPILAKLTDETDDEAVENLVNSHNAENEKIGITYGRI